MRLQRNKVSRERGRVPNVFQHRNPDLRVLLQPGMTGEFEKAEEGEAQESGEDGEARARHCAGVLSNCCFVQMRFGFNSTAVARALRASALRFCFRNAMPSQRWASADLGSS